MFKALNVTLGKEYKGECVSFQKEEYNALQMSLAKSSIYILLLLMIANKYCSSLPSVSEEQRVCLSVQRGTLQSGSVTPVLLQSWAHLWVIHRNTQVIWPVTAQSSNVVKGQRRGKAQALLLGQAALLCWVLS